MRAAHVCVLTVCCGLLSTSLTAIAAPPANAEFTAARQTFLRDMKRIDPASRAAAASSLAKVKHSGAADLLLKRGVTDEDQQVREASRSALRQLSHDPEVSQYLCDELKKSLRKPALTEPTIDLLRAVVATESTPRQSDVLTCLNDYLASPKGNLLLPITVIDEAAHQTDPATVRSLRLFARADVFAEKFGYRRSIVQALTQIPNAAAVDFLIEMLPQTEGLIQYDTVSYLTRLTKQSFRANQAEWQKWWQDNRSTFEFPKDGLLDEDLEVDERQLSYYRIPICAKRVVFVLDTSLSMRGLPIDAAKLALIKTVESLPEAVSFDIVMFDTTAVTWNPRLIKATPEAKRLASTAIQSRGLGPATVSSAALHAAFRLDPETIYFVSDGEPTDAPPAEIVAACTQLNRVRRVSIHTIGVVTSRHGGAGLQQFMQPLSDQNYGTFRLID